MRKTTLLKKLILDPEILVMPGAYDAMSAKIIAQSGFQSVVIGGYATSAALLGKPDVGLLSFSEMLSHARYIAAAVDIPVFADGDTGYGNVTNVQRTIREYESAGVAGLFIEDQVFPKRCGHMEGKEVVSVDEMTAKIKSAVDARIDPDFVIMARTDALAVFGLQDAIERANLYRQAGADAIFVEAPCFQEELTAVAREIDAPVFASMLEGGKTPVFTPKALEKMGFKGVFYGLSTLYAAAWATRAVLAEIRDRGTTERFLNQMITFHDFNRLVDLDGIREKERSFYPGDSSES
ncbi:MAG: oxaloacetate decarboxylase [Syntrophaceae bacterium]|nr:oxaloacetate decarboxylase [Syntrophaceae bacterium]